MASKATGNNCPTSDRDGKCVDRVLSHKTLIEIEKTNGCLFLPDRADIQAREARAAEAEMEYLFLEDEDWDMTEDGEVYNFREPEKE